MMTTVKAGILPALQGLTLPISVGCLLHCMRWFPMVISEKALDFLGLPDLWLPLASECQQEKAFHSQQNINPHSRYLRCMRSFLSAISEKVLGFLCLPNPRLPLASECQQEKAFHSQHAPKNPHSRYHMVPLNTTFSSTWCYIPEGC